MDAVEVEELLEHTGIKGMHWGVRRKNPSNSKSLDVVNDKTGERISVSYDPSKMSIDSTTGKMRGSKAEVQAFQKKVDDAGKILAKSEADSIDYKNSIAAQSKPASHLSNQEMQALVTRMDLEQRYQSAIAKANLQPPTKKAKVAKFATDLLRDIGQQEIRRVLKGKAALAVEAALVKNNSEDLARRITPKKQTTGGTGPKPGPTKASKAAQALFAKAQTAYKNRKNP